MGRKAGIYIYTALGFEAFGLILAFILVGNWLDGKFGWSGLGVAGGAAFGVFAWLAHAVIIVNRLAKDENSSDTDRS